MVFSKILQRFMEKRAVLGHNGALTVVWASFFLFRLRA